MLKRSKCGLGHPGLGTATPLCKRSRDPTIAGSILLSLTAFYELNPVRWDIRELSISRFN